MNLYDVVELAVDLPDEGLRAGAVGTIVDDYAGSGEFEVEFTDDAGRTLALTALRADQLRARG
ncbi:MAG TPA: DUF4926 domain-containing protein [Actinophytocola sp.]|jgi:hypothetical protein|nr:DUF4926 domain-containing protein [Actinophytocola sp.]